MFKVAKLLLVVDSLDKAIKFYTEKLLFNIVELKVGSEGGIHLTYAELRRGKCHLVLRMPIIDELAEFSMVRRCSGRAAGLVLELKRDIEHFYQSCRKKQLHIVSELNADGPEGRSFAIKDPFGLRLQFFQASAEQSKDQGRTQQSFVGLSLTKAAASGKSQDEVFAAHLRTLGISRRAAKKYIKLWHKER